MTEPNVSPASERAHGLSEREMLELAKKEPRKALSLLAAEFQKDEAVSGWEPLGRDHPIRVALDKLTPQM